MDQFLQLNMKACGHTSLEISELVDPVVWAAWYACIKPALRDVWTVDVAWIKQRDWTVALVPDNTKNDCVDETRNFATLSNGFKAHNIHTIYGINHEGKWSQTYTINTSPEGLLQFHWQTQVVQSSLFLPGIPFLILLTSEEYWLYAGEKAFVESCLGMSLSESYQQFQTFAEDNYDYFLRDQVYYKDVWLK